MKRLLPLFAILSLISCTKEKNSNSIVGTWDLSQINSANNSSILLSRTELAVQFTNKDSLVILGPKPNYSYLENFNKYEIIGSDRIRFFNTSTTDQLFAIFNVDKTLSLSYEVRCPYEEKFIRR